MKNKPLLCIVFFLAIGAQVPLLADPWDREVPASLDALTANYWLPSLKVAFGSFTYGYTDLPSPFSAYVQEKAAKAVSATKTLHFFNKDAILTMDPAFKKTYEDAFKKGEADALLAGRFFDEGRSVRVHLELTGLSDGLLIGALDCAIPKEFIPANLPISPEKTASETKESLAGLFGSQTMQKDAESLSVAVTTSKGANAVYHEGERLTVFVQTNKRAYLKVYHVGADHKTQLIWPNRFGGNDGLIEPGIVVSVPSPGDPFAFKLEAPFGTEFIKVVASSTPFAGIESDFEDAEEPARQYISKGLAPRGDDAVERAESLTSYIILPIAK